MYHLPACVCPDRSLYVTVNLEPESDRKIKTLKFCGCESVWLLFYTVVNGKCVQSLVKSCRKPNTENTAAYFGAFGVKGKQNRKQEST